MARNLQRLVIVLSFIVGLSCQFFAENWRHRIASPLFLTRPLLTMEYARLGMAAIIAAHLSNVDRFLSSAARG